SEGVGRSAAELEAVAGTILDRLDLPARGFTVRTFVERAGAVLGHPIRLVPYTCPPQAHGALVRTQRHYLLFFRSNTDPLFGGLIVYHELAHLFLGHAPLGRTARLYDPAEEREADALAAILLSCSLGWGMISSRRIRESDRRLWTVFK
ncbi:MAG TPA: hypothetical protein VF234_02225, partial [Limnochordia bacterium]